MLGLGDENCVVCLDCFFLARQTKCLPVCLFGLLAVSECRHDVVMTEEKAYEVTSRCHARLFISCYVEDDFSLDRFNT